MTTIAEDTNFFTLDELRDIQLGVLIPIAQRMGLKEAVAAKRDTIVGMVYVAQKQHPDVLEEARERLMNIASRHVSTVTDISKDAPAKPRQRSAVYGAVAKVHEICNKMKGQPRKAVIEECVKAGINENTAKTQYAKWARDQK